jgi:thiol-disulfide isomerase/thioredoxin
MKSLAFAAAVGLLAAGCAPDPPPPRTAAAFDPAELEEPVGPPSAVPLAPGTKFPPFRAAGWLNGRPPEFGAPGLKGVVVDLWSEWCPFCRRTAPELVTAYEKYAPRGVRFVSLTDLDQAAVTGFVSRFGVTWPSGYGVTIPTFAAYGARHTAIPVRGYDVFPTLYVLNPDGTVRWCDQRARARHVDPAKVRADLGAALDDLLAASP